MTHPHEPINAITSQGLFEPTYGLTKREYFAAMAMQGICANPEFCTTESEKRIAQLLIRQADALIAELNKVTP